MRAIPCDIQLQSVHMHQQPLKWGSKIARVEGEREAITTSVLASAVQCRALVECTRAQHDGGTATATSTTLTPTKLSRTGKVAKSSSFDCKGFVAFWERHVCRAGSMLGVILSWGTTNRS